MVFSNRLLELLSTNPRPGGMSVNTNRFIWFWCRFKSIAKHSQFNRFSFLVRGQNYAGHAQASHVNIISTRYIVSYFMFR